MLNFLSFPNGTKSKHGVLSHFPGQKEVTQSRSLSPAYSHIHANTNTPQGSGLTAHWRVWKGAKARAPGGLSAGGGIL